jgi:uncharacterized tellurite resistance protein B-like protein
VNPTLSFELVFDRSLPTDCAPGSRNPFVTKLGYQDAQGALAMPIIAVVLTLTFWTLYWFVRMGGIHIVQAKQAQRKAAADLANAQAAKRNAPLRAIDDPRDAATILMLLIAREGGDPTREQIAAIEKTIRSTFGLELDLPERMAQARFIASRADSFAQAAAIFSDLFNKRLTADEKRQLVQMIEEIAALDGPSSAHTEAVDVLTRRIGVMSAA